MAAAVRGRGGGRQPDEEGKRHPRQTVLFAGPSGQKA